jgi:hypothetical protein
MYQFGCSRRYPDSQLVKHDSGCVYEGVFGLELILQLVDQVKKIALSNAGGLVQSVEALN